MRNRIRSWNFQRICGMLCLFLLLAGCGGDPTPQPPVEPPVFPETPTVSQPEVPEDPLAEPETPAESPAEPEPEPDLKPEPEPEPKKEPALYCHLQDMDCVTAHWENKLGTLVIVKMRAENPSEAAVQLKYTVQALGNITTATATDGMSADRIAASEPSEHFAVYIQTSSTEEEDATPIKTVDAVESTSTEIGAGQTAMLYLYLLLPEEVEHGTTLHIVCDSISSSYLTLP